MAVGITEKGNLAEIFNRVSGKVSSSETRSLWEKMRDEMRSGGPDAAARYLGAELDRCRQVFAREMEALEADYSQRGSS